MGAELSIKLDKKDIDILKELDLNARNSHRSIGKKIKKSKEFVRYRIQKLTDAGVIDSFITSVDYSKLGMYRVCLYLKFKEMTDELRTLILNYKKTRDCRIKFFSVGRYDVYIDVNKIR